MDWHEMKQFHRGKDNQGRDMFNIPLQPDDDGMVGRECPNADCQPRYFKITPPDHLQSDGAGQAKPPVESLCCPYCARRDGFQQFTTEEQIQWVKSLMLRDVVRQVQRTLQSAFRTHTRPAHGGIFTVRLSYKPGRLPSVRHYAEKRLRNIVRCDQCNETYAVYGVAPVCPFCGMGNLSLHLKRSLGVILSLLEFRPEVEAKAGQDAGYHLLGNCLEDCISLFEGFLKVIYERALPASLSLQDRRNAVEAFRNTFQSLSRAQTAFQAELSYDLFQAVSALDLDFLEVQFAKRHVITHNLSLVDGRYRTQADAWQRSGQDLDLSPEDVLRLADRITTVLSAAIAHFRL